MKKVTKVTLIRQIEQLIESLQDENEYLKKLHKKVTKSTTNNLKDGT